MPRSTATCPNITVARRTAKRYLDLQVALIQFPLWRAASGQLDFGVWYKRLPGYFHLDAQPFEQTTELARIGNDGSRTTIFTDCHEPFWVQSHNALVTVGIHEVACRFPGA